MRTHLPIGPITSITIHWIGPYPAQSPNDVKHWWDTVEPAAHYIIKDDKLLQYAPIDELCYHCGKADGNASSIGIEVIPMSKSGAFSERSILTLKELIATLPDVPLKRHYDWTGKDCPQYYTPLGVGGDAAWNDLVKELKA